MENPQPTIAEILLEEEPSIVNEKDDEGYTALHLAVIAGNTPLIDVLLENSADVQETDNEGHTAIHWATGNIVCSSFRDNKIPRFEFNLNIFCFYY